MMMNELWIGNEIQSYVGFLFNLSSLDGNYVRNQGKNKIRESPSKSLSNVCL